VNTNQYLSLVLDAPWPCNN